MTILAVLLIPLAGLQAAYGIPEPTVLDKVGTDTIKDVIRYYNEHQYPPQIARVSAPLKVNTFINGTYFNMTASNGLLKSRDVSLATDLAVVKYFAGVLPDSQLDILHVVESDFPIAINNIHLRYDLHVKTDTDPWTDLGAHPEVPPSLKVTFGKNKFVLNTRLYHIIRRNGSSRCITTVKDVKADKFKVEKVVIKNLNVIIPSVVAELANKYKEALQQEKSYIGNAIQEIINRIAPKLSFYCQYVPAGEVERIIGQLEVASL